MPLQDNMTDLEEGLAQSAGKNFQEMLDLSLNGDVMCQLVDDVSWSPMDIKTSNRRHKVVSPAKQYVRSRSTELNTLAGNIAVQDTEASHRNKGMFHYLRQDVNKYP